MLEAHWLDERWGSRSVPQKHSGRWVLFRVLPQVSWTDSRVVELVLKLVVNLELVVALVVASPNPPAEAPTPEGVPLLLGCTNGKGNARLWNSVAQRR